MHTHTHKYTNTDKSRDLTARSSTLTGQKRITRMKDGPGD